MSILTRGSASTACKCSFGALRLQSEGDNPAQAIACPTAGGDSTHASNAYRARLKELGIRMSLGSKGSCYDNARMESLNGIIKTEALYCAFGKSKVNARRIPQAQVLERVLQFIGYYNGERSKARLGMMSPVQFSSSGTPTAQGAYGFKRRAGKSP